MEGYWQGQGDRGGMGCLQPAPTPPTPPPASPLSLGCPCTTCMQTSRAGGARSVVGGGARRTTRSLGDRGCVNLKCRPCNSKRHYTLTRISFPVELLEVDQSTPHRKSPPHCMHPAHSGVGTAVNEERADHFPRAWGQCCRQTLPQAGPKVHCTEDPGAHSSHIHKIKHGMRGGGGLGWSQGG